MPNVTEHLIRESNNVITLTLQEDGSAISGSWTNVDIDILHPLSGAVLVNLTRNADGDGIALNTSTGVLTIEPDDLSAGDKTNLATLNAGFMYPVRVTVKTGTDAGGLVFGGVDSTDRLAFFISDNTAP